MELKQLEYFLVIAKSGSLAAAADVIGVAQPSLSVQLKNLESRLSTELFVRSPKGVSLTNAGIILLERAQSILNMVEETRNEVRQAGITPAGKVVFGFPSSVSMILSVPLAETIRVEFPDIRLRAVDAMSGFIKEWLEQQSIDLAILYETSGLKNAEITKLLEEEMHFYAPPDLWPLNKPPGTPISLSELSDVELVLPSKSHGLRMLIDRATKSNLNKLNIVVEMDSLTQIKSLVSRGSAATILAPAAVSDYVERNELVSSKIIDPVISRPVFLVRNPEKPRTRASQVVEKSTIEIVRELVKMGRWGGKLESEVPSITI